jgi:hypothetical protein
MYPATNAEQAIGRRPLAGASKQLFPTASYAWHSGWLSGESDH